MDAPSVTGALVFFGKVFDQGRNNLTGQATALFHTFVIFEIIFAGLYLALGTGADLKGVARKLLVIGFFSWVIQNYAWLLTQVMDGFILVGQKAGSSSGITFATLQDPGLIFVRGMEVTKPAADKLFQIIDESYTGILSADALLLVVSIVLSVLAFGIMAVQVFVTYLEFLIVSTAGFIFLPFGVFKPTAFLAERMFGAIIGFGIKLMVLALIIAISDQFLATIALPEQVSWQQCFDLVVVALALCFLSLHAPSVALSLLNGSPHLSFGSVATTVAGTALATSKSAESVGGGIIGGASAVGGATIKAAGAISGAGSATYQQSKQNGDSSAMSMAKAVGAGAIAPVTAAISSQRDSIEWGKDGGPNGQRQYRASIGDESLRANPKDEGIRGKFNAGKFSTSTARNHDAKKREAGAGKPDSKQEQKSQQSNNQNNGEKDSTL